MKCEICGRKCKNIICLSSHIRKHKISSEDYYYKYLRKNKSEGICLRCRKKTNFVRISCGYCKYCSLKCVANSQKIQKKKEETNLKHCGYKHNSQSLEIKKKKEETNLKHWGFKNPLQSKKIQEIYRKTCKEHFGFENPNQTLEGKQRCRIRSIKQRDLQILNSEPSMPWIGNTEREFLNVLQKYTKYKIIRNDPFFRYIVGRYPDGHIPELQLFIQFDECHHFLDKECKIYKQDDINCTLELASLGYIVWRVSELEWKNNREKIIKQFKFLVQNLQEEQ